MADASPSQQRKTWSDCVVDGLDHHASSTRVLMRGGTDRPCWAQQSGAHVKRGFDMHAYAGPQQQCPWLSAKNNMQRTAQHAALSTALHVSAVAALGQCGHCRCLSCQPELAQQATDWHSFSCCLDTPTGATATATSHTPAAAHQATGPLTGPLAAAATAPPAAAAAAAPIILREGHQPVAMPGTGPATTPTPTERYSEVGAVTLHAYFTIP
jgi:hypothetical protein